jgi:solute carrier family 25 phosphate transporter 23/24/25/41
LFGDEPGVVGLFACSATAGIVGQLTCYPFHVIMARMATQGTPGMPKLYSGTWDAFRKTYQKEGVKGFYRGMGITFLKSIPAQAITLITYEYLKKYLHLEKKKHH